ncbi:hypothetical protein BDM02DRAFT_3258688 [Thelephora ganbajun]|uniref:Uncharacterized protein n=1 Tax=Thelephora ganbajun TaxID=370292 RepID=A0ACB6ZRP5_THEGA|nr:hypothetical protein BDM02DRAFT_3258688 [Thelephora ganbajun]
MISYSLALLVLSRLVLGAVTPTAPGPGEVLAAGSKCSISWTPDESGKWKTFSIDLMSGSNSNMTLVTNVAEDLDGTDSSLSPYTWTCPEVDPYSAIYFYQFNAAVDKSSPAWTTRFTITSSAGETTVPPHSKQPNGDDVPWGIGVMLSGSPVASREKHYGKGSMEEEDPDENYSNDDDEVTGQQSSKSKAKGGTDYDQETPTTKTSARKGGSASIGTSSESGDAEYKVGILQI